MAIGFPVKANYVTGEVLTATNMNDLSGSVNLLQSAQYAAGKNKIINGDFGVWQRGTSFTNPAAFSYSVDRWRWGSDGTTQTTIFSQQTFTPGTAPVTGYEGTYFLRWNRSVAGTGATYDDFYQPIEDVRTFAGQTATVSFWAKADSARTLNVLLSQNFGSGGSAQVSNIGTTSLSVTTSWARYSATITVPSVSGKTIGTGSSLGYIFRPNTLNTTFTFDIWGVQIEEGSTASEFQTATGTIQGELAACQRYLPAFTGPNSAVMGYAYGTNTSLFNIPFPVTARVAPTGVTNSGTTNAYALNTATSVTPAFSVSSINNCQITASHTITAGQGAQLVVGGLLLFTGCEL